MTYHFGRFWAEIRPVRSEPDDRILYWKYRIFESGSDTFLFDGHDADFEAARMTAEAHINLLNDDDRNLIDAA